MIDEMGKNIRHPKEPNGDTFAQGGSVANVKGILRGQRWHLLALLVLAFLLASAAAVMPSSALAAAGGPVLLDGGDFPDHGGYDGTNLTGAWMYAEAAVNNIAPVVTRFNDGSIALLGSADSTSTSSQTGANYHWLGVVLGKTISYHEGATAINQFFTDLAAGSINPAIIVTAGTGSGNDLSGAEGTALAGNAVAIADFVNSGGGLIGHGSGTTAFGWLATLLPGINFPSGCSSGTLALTPEGVLAFPSLTNTAIKSGPCHGNFTGNLGGLEVLAKDGSDRNIIIGGAQVSLPGSIALDPAKATNCAGTRHIVTATVKDSSDNLQSGKAVSFVVTGANSASGPGSSPTDANGEATFDYVGSNVGTDTITASFVDDAGTPKSTSAEKIWEQCIASVGGSTSFLVNDSGSSAGLWTILAGLGAAGLAMLVAGGWYTRQRMANQG